MPARRRLPAFTGSLPADTREGRSRPVAGGYLAAVAAVVLVTVLIALIPGAAHVANISLLYLSGVIACGLWFGSRPAILAAILSVLAFDFCFVAPFQTFTVSDPAEWLALLTFLLTAGVTGHLTAELQARAAEARRREQEAIALKQVSWTIASQTSTFPAIASVLSPLLELAGATAVAVLVWDEGQPPRCMAATGDGTIDVDAPPTRQAIDDLLDEASPIPWDRERQLWGKVLAGPAQTEAVYLPLQIEHHRLGALVLHIPAGRLQSPNVRRLVETMANHAAVILERDRLMGAELRAKALAEADRLKTALLAMVSHDFRSPLASIKASAASLAAIGPAPDPVTRQDLLDGITHATDRLNRMVGNILALSRLDADAWRPQTELTPVAEVIEAALASFSAAENRRVRVVLADPWLEAQLDPVQIARVIHNLVENALKYAPAEQVVQVQADGQGHELVVEVLDRGPGIAPGDEACIFERFYRAPSLQESAIPGLGIGLAICKGLVEAHGGSLSAMNREGGGVCLRMALPVLVAQPARPENAR
jgi:two-component system sensor histidine kinase KdpD